MARNTTQTPDSPAFSRTSRLVRSWQEQLQGTTLGFGPQTQAQASFHLANQVQLQRQTSQPALAFAIEPPALVEYSNSTGATIHCRAQLSLGPGQQQQQIPTISWRLVNTANPHQWDELELPMERTTTKSGQKKSDGLTRRARFVRQDGALMLAPFAAEQYEPDLHSASYRCCLAPSAATSYAGDFPPSTICSRLVRTRAGKSPHPNPNPSLHLILVIHYAFSNLRIDSCFFARQYQLTSRAWPLFRQLSAGWNAI